MLICGCACSFDTYWPCNFPHCRPCYSSMKPYKTIFKLVDGCQITLVVYLFGRRKRIFITMTSRLRLLAPLSWVVTCCTCMIAHVHLVFLMHVCLKLLFYELHLVEPTLQEWQRVFKRGCFRMFQIRLLVTLITAFFMVWHSKTLTINNSMTKGFEREREIVGFRVCRRVHFRKGGSTLTMTFGQTWTWYRGTCFHSHRCTNQTPALFLFYLFI